MERAISIFGYQRLAELNQRLGVAQHMRFTDLVLHTNLIGDQHLGAHTLGNRLNPSFECLAILGLTPVLPLFEQSPSTGFLKSPGSTKEGLPLDERQNDEVGEPPWKHDADASKKEPRC